jgi:glycosyltransferase involved in cell wall biosynthesis
MPSEISSWTEDFLNIEGESLSMADEQQIGTAVLNQRSVPKLHLRRVAIFTSCDSFEGFYGGTFGIDRETYLKSYRNDFVWEYAQGLEQQGHEVFIYILSYGRPELCKISERLKVRFLPLPRWLRAIDPLLWRLRGIKHGPSLRDGIAYRGYGRALQAALKADCVDVMYHQEIWTSRFDIVVRKTPVPVIGADQGAVFVEWSAPAKARSLKLAARLICQSHTGLERACSFGAEPVLMYNGVDTNFFRPPESTRLRTRTVLAVGRLVEEQKRFSDLLIAMRSLPDFTLTLVGSGPDENKLKKLAGELGIADRVTFAGFIKDRQQLRHLYQECGVFVSTSKWEAVALVMLEAMSCAAPVVATHIPSFEDLLNDGIDGILVRVGAPEEVAHAIGNAFERQKQLGINARNTVVNRYSSQALYNRLSSMIETI